MNHPDINLEEILNDRAVEEDLLEIPLTDKVFRIFSLIVFVITAVVLIKMVGVGIVNHPFYSKRALLNVSEVKIESAPRGIISDRFGKPMVTNEPSFNVFLSPKLLPQTPEERTKAIEEISRTLVIQKSELNQKIAKKDWGLNDRLLLANNVSHNQLVSLYSTPIAGIQIEPSFTRTPTAYLKFSHILGFVGLVDEKDLKNNESLIIDDEIGRSGLEAYYDKYLRGVNGKQVFYRNASGKIKEEKAVQSSKPGFRLETFVDSEFQEYFHDTLQAALNRLGKQVGAGLAINPQNGEVLALISIPGFDSSNIVDVLNDPTKPLFNRTVAGLYNPGSTIKPLVATAVLSEGLIKPEKQIFSAGFIELPNPYDPEKPSRFLDWKAHGWVDLYSAIARSSNIYFYTVGGGFGDQKGLGIVKLKEWWQNFGLDKKTGIDLPGEKAGFLPDPEWKEKSNNGIWRLGDTYNVAIGQGDLSVSLLEILNYIGAIANGGKFYEPRVMKEIKNEEDKVVLASKPTLLRDESSKIGGVLPEVQRAMWDAVREPYGTAYLLHDLPMSVAAKTGSAQVENNTKVNAFTVGYAPFLDPQIAILILVENASEGSLNTVPVARDILMWYYKNRLSK